MMKEVENAFVLQQARDEVEIGFPVLHLVFIGGIAALQPELEIVEPVVREDLFRNVDDVLVLKNAIYFFYSYYKTFFL